MALTWLASWKILTGFIAFCLKVHIEFTEGEDKITLEGPTEDVNVAQEQIEVMVKDLVSWCY